MTVADRRERRGQHHAPDARVARGAQHAQGPRPRRSDELLLVAGQLRRERRRHVQDVVAPGDRLGPAAVGGQIGGGERQPLARLDAARPHGGAHLVGAGQAAHGGAHLVPRAEQLHHAMTGDEARAAGHQHLAHGSARRSSMMNPDTGGAGRPPGELATSSAKTTSLPTSVGSGISRVAVGPSWTWDPSGSVAVVDGVLPPLTDLERGLAPFAGERKRKPTARAHQSIGEANHGVTGRDREAHREPRETGAGAGRADARNRRDVEATSACDCRRPDTRQDLGTAQGRAGRRFEAVLRNQRRRRAGRERRRSRRRRGMASEVGDSVDGDGVRPAVPAKDRGAVERGREVAAGGRRRECRLEAASPDQPWGRAQRQRLRRSHRQRAEGIVRGPVGGHGQYRRDGVGAAGQRRRDGTGLPRIAVDGCPGSLPRPGERSVRHQHDSETVGVGDSPGSRGPGPEADLTLETQGTGAVDRERRARRPDDGRLGVGVDHERERVRCRPVTARVPHRRQRRGHEVGTPTHERPTRGRRSVARGITDGSVARGIADNPSPASLVGAPAAPAAASLPPVGRRPPAPPLPPTPSSWWETFEHPTATISAAPHDNRKSFMTTSRP